MNGRSIVATCCQLSSTIVEAQSVRNCIVVGLLSWQHLRQSTVSSTNWSSISVYSTIPSRGSICDSWYLIVQRFFSRATPRWAGSKKNRLLQAGCTSYKPKQQCGIKRRINATTATKLTQLYLLLHAPDGISIGYAVVAGLTVMSDTHTERKPQKIGNNRPHLCTACLRCGLIIIIIININLPNNTRVCTSTSIQFRREGQQGPTITLTAALKRVIKQLLGTYSITQTREINLFNAVPENI